MWSFRVEGVGQRVLDLAFIFGARRGPLALRNCTLHELQDIISQLLCRNSLSFPNLGTAWKVVGPLRCMTHGASGLQRRCSILAAECDLRHLARAAALSH